MAKLTLNLDTIGELQAGLAREAIDREIARAVADLMDRGEEDGKARKVAITLEMKLSKGLIILAVAAQAKLPPLQTGGTASEVRFRRPGVPELTFQANSPDNPSQSTLDEFERKEGE